MLEESLTIDQHISNIDDQIEICMIRIKARKDKIRVLRRIKSDLKLLQSYKEKLKENSEDGSA